MPDPTHEFTFQFDREWLSHGIRRSFSRRTLAGLLTFLALTGAALAIVFGPAVLLNPGVGVTLIAGMAAVTGILMWRFRHATEQVYELWAKQAPDHTLIYRLHPDSIEIIVGASQSTYQYSDLRRIQRGPQMWHLEIAQGIMLFYPAAAPQEATQFLLGRCEELGVQMSP